jgi:integrase
LVIVAAASTGSRQSELLGLRWKHVDLRAQRIRLRNRFATSTRLRVLARFREKAAPAHRSLVQVVVVAEVRERSVGGRI